jgi:hypothetical protein
MPITFISLEERALSVARLLLAQPDPAREDLILALEHSEAPGIQGSLDRLIGAQARKLLQEQSNDRNAPPQGPHGATR